MKGDSPHTPQQQTLGSNGSLCPT